jgi:putative flippase GtrA
VSGELGRFLRANLASTLATLLDWIAVTVLVAAAVHYLVAAAAGALVGAATDFTLKRHWAFLREVPGTVTAEGARYLAVAIASLGWNLAASWILVGAAGLPPVPGVVAASLIVGVGWNYPLHRLFVFR